ncbi:MAG: pilus assembly PilX N-terminal domain-containing protein [Syntrophomonadaceae bacterium]|nr:pilus assembly PilX N-terminal domain-containing protein [Syntrophomonadaceae bacterium]
MRAPVRPQAGNTTVMALMLFLILSIMTTMLISIASIEKMITANDAHTEQARQAADAGIQIARNIIMNYLVVGEALPLIPQINLGEGVSASVNIDTTRIDTDAIITIIATGVVKSTEGKVLADKTAETRMLVNGLPVYPLRCKWLKVMGKYFATIANKPAYLEGTLATELVNVQDWDTRGWDMFGYPVHGPPYGDQGFSYVSHPNFVAFNPNNPDPTRNYTWWVEYEYTYSQTGEKVDNDIPNSRLYVAPIWKPTGIVNICEDDNDADSFNNPPAKVVAASGWDNDLTEVSHIFDGKLTNPEPADYPLICLKENLDSARIYWPETEFSCEDFVGKLTGINSGATISLKEEQLDKFRQLAMNTRDWQYINQDSHLLELADKPGYYNLLVDDPELKKSKIFIDINKDSTVILDFTTVAHYTQPIFSWAPESLSGVINHIQNQPGTFFNRFSHELDNIIVISPASLDVGLDSFMFAGVDDFRALKPAIFLISEQNISLTIEPAAFNGINRIWANAGADREMQAFLMAGKDIYITSTPQVMTIKGILSAGEGITLLIDYFTEHEEGLEPNREIEKNINIIKDTGIANKFPGPWAYLGLGPLVSYKYID